MTTRVLWRVPARYVLRAVPGHCPNGMGRSISSRGGVRSRVDASGLEVDEVGAVRSVFLRRRCPRTFGVGDMVCELFEGAAELREAPRSEQVCDVQFCGLCFF